MVLSYWYEFNRVGKVTIELELDKFRNKLYLDKFEFKMPDLLILF